MAEAFERIHTTFDRLEAEMVAEVLVREGIDARLIGTTGAALIGASPHILRLRIEVPRESAAQAREIVAALLGADSAAAAAAAEAEATAPPGEGADAAAGVGAAAGAEAGLPAAQAPPVESEPAASTPRPRHPLLAAGAAFVLPGGSHIYARHPWAGLILAAGFLVTLVAMLAGARSHVAVASGALTLCALLLADLVGGQLAARRANLGVLPSRARQLLRGLILVAAAVASGVLAGSRMPVPKPKPDPFLHRHRALPDLGGGSPRGLPDLTGGSPSALPLVPPELEIILQRRGAASQPASAPFLWPRSGIPDLRPPTGPNPP